MSTTQRNCQQGRLEGEVRGGVRGIVAGKIQLMQELLGVSVTPNVELLAQELPSLEATLRRAAD